MSDEQPFDREIAAKASRKLKALRVGTQSPWFGLRMVGMVGWSVAVPTVGGALLGAWLDRRWPGMPSWTLMLLLAGMLLGCVNAWRWIVREGANE